MRTAGVVVSIVAAGALAPSAAVTWAGTLDPAQTAGEVQSTEVWTAEEYLERAASYREKADAYRAEAEVHRKMLADFEKKRAHPVHKTTSRKMSPSIEKMRTHCEGYIENAERLATEADELAALFQALGEGMGEQADAAPSGGA